MLHYHVDSTFNYLKESPMSTATAITTGTWSVEPVHSEVGFTVRHLGMSKVRGRFNSFTGTVQIGGDPSDSSVTAQLSRHQQR